ncbi:MAG: InlB B-repeat-containing protein, partial [Eubacterium sp.]|nr:InlB B-repeat-containing protein [Eubacterium sp.]
MTKNRGKKLLSLFMASVISASMLTVVGGPVSQVNAEEGDKQVACLGTSDINEPEPGETDKSWTGSFVWYGTYNGKPVRYRVLDPKTSKFGGTTMFLDCDSILYKAKFDEDGIANEGAANPNEWAYSDVRTGLNGSAFLEKAESFTDSEKAAIAYSNIISHKLNAEGEVQVEDWTKDTFEDYVALEDDKVFLLDMEDISNNAYGYSVVDDLVEYRIKKSDSETDLGWWSRSAIKSLSNYVGGVFPYGAFTGGSVDKYYGVSPAFNVNLESVIFSSIIPETAGEKYADYKLTLLDGDITVAVQSGKKIEVNGDKVTVPYAISGANNTHATQISVLILDKDYQKANANDAEILYYGKLDVKGIFSTKKGEGTFEFPSELDKSKWGTDYQVYLLAEDVNGEKKSDYASEPVKLDIPEALVDYTVTVTNDGNGTAEASVEKGTEGTEVTLTATPKSGYQFKEWQVISGGVTINDNKFKIGNANVEIKAVFEPISFTVEPTPTPEVEPTPDITRDANDISPSNPVKVDEIEKTILSIKDEKDTAGSTFTLLKAK